MKTTPETPEHFQLTGPWKTAVIAMKPAQGEWMRVERTGQVVHFDEQEMRRQVPFCWQARAMAALLDYDRQSRRIDVPQTCGFHSQRLGVYPPPPGSHDHRLSIGQDEQP